MQYFFPHFVIRPLGRFVSLDKPYCKAFTLLLVPLNELLLISIVLQLDGNNLAEFEVDLKCIHQIILPPTVCVLLAVELERVGKNVTWVFVLLRNDLYVSIGNCPGLLQPIGKSFLIKILVLVFGY